MICNLGAAASISSDNSFLTPNCFDSLDNIRWDSGGVQRAFENLLTVGQAVCSACSEELEAASNARQLLPTEDTIEPRLTECLMVTTIRFIIKDSFEEHVLKIQDRKKHLAALLLSQTKLSEGDLARSRLLHLRSLLD